MTHRIKTISCHNAIKIHVYKREIYINTNLKRQFYGVGAKSRGAEMKLFPEPGSKSRIAAPAPFYLPQTRLEVFVNFYNFNPIT